MARDSAFVEDQETIDIDRSLQDLMTQVVEWSVRETTIWIGKQGHGTNAEYLSSTTQFVVSQGPEISPVTAQGRFLAVSKAEDRHIGALGDEGREQSTEPEGFVVGVCDDGEQPAHARKRAVYRRHRVPHLSGQPGRYRAILQPPPGAATEPEPQLPGLEKVDTRRRTS
jgi:hypothetical protein